MEDMAARYADRSVRSVFLYTREAHPGEFYRHHTSMEVKRHHARALQQEFSFKREILLDDLEGTAHRAYGSLPNMSWIIGPGGIIHYKATWTDPADIEEALKEVLRDAERRAKGGFLPYHSERLRWRGRDDAKFRERLEKNGPQAVTDFYGKK
jgi:hypothetical protein